MKMDKITNKNSVATLWMFSFICFLSFSVTAEWISENGRYKYECPQGMSAAQFGFEASDNRADLPSQGRPNCCPNDGGCKDAIVTQIKFCKCPETYTYDGGEHCNKTLKEKQLVNEWTTAPTGAACFFDPTDKSCAACAPGGCQCGGAKYACVKCGDTSACGKMTPDMSGMLIPNVCQDGYTFNNSWQEGDYPCQKFAQVACNWKE